MESQMYGTPVLGANIGGIPELIRVGETGELFESSNGDELNKTIQVLYRDEAQLTVFSDNCSRIQFDDLEQYVRKLICILGDCA
jgi:glycosyltransferase involved in cell wall biosynthesis